MSIKLGGIRIRMTPAFAVFFAACANIFTDYAFLYSFLFSLLHEAVHLVSLRCFGIREAVLEFLPGGIKMSPEGMGGLSYKKTVICSLSAPLFNLMAGALFYGIFSLFGNTVCFECAVINFMLGGVNLLPLSFLDGGRAMTSVLSIYFDCFTVRKITAAVSIVTVITLFSVFFVLFCMKKYYLLLLFFCIYCVLGCMSDKL